MEGQPRQYQFRAAIGPGARLRTGFGAMPAQLPLHFLGKDLQHLPRQRRVALQRTLRAFR